MTVIERIMARPERNVGSGDFATRVLATLVLAGLAVVVLPQLGISYSFVKISLLTAAELGLIILMLGLFLRTKTHFAGLQLLVAPMAMLWLTARQLVYPAAAVGVLFCIAGVVNLVTRRSRVNQVLNLSSLRQAIADVSPAPKEHP